jgi:sulfate permease, SulP family
MLTEGVKRHRENGIAVWLVGMNPTVFAMIQKSQLGQMLGWDAMHFNLEIAIAKFLSMASEDQGRSRVAKHEDKAPASLERCKCP